MRRCWIFLLSSFATASVAIAAPCSISTKEKTVGDGATLVIQKDECPNSDRRVIKVLLKSDSESIKVLVRKTQTISATPFGNGSFIDIEGDDVPEVDIVGECAAPNCEHNIYKLTDDHQTMAHYYSGYHFDMARTPNYLVTSSYGNYVSWGYCASDPAPQRLPISDCKYSIYVGMSERTQRLICEIRKIGADKKSRLAIPPPEELLRFCYHYGEEEPVKIMNLVGQRKNGSR